MRALLYQPDLYFQAVSQKYHTYVWLQDQSCIFREEGTRRKRIEYFYILTISIKVVQFDILKIVKCQCFSIYTCETKMIITELSVMWM